MIKYTFKYGPFYFNIIAEHDLEAIEKAKAAMFESSEGVHAYANLRVELLAGAFDGNICVQPDDISTDNILKKEEVETADIIPF